MKFKVKGKWKAWFDFSAYGDRVVRFFFTEDGGKQVARKLRIFCAFVLVVGFGAFITVWMNLDSDTSFFGRTDRPLGQGKDGTTTTGSTPPAKTGRLGRMFQLSESKGVGGSKGSAARTGSSKVNYKAQQVFVSDGGFDPSRTMPMGTNLIGKTLTTIDTRESSQLVKVLLPYGGRASAGGELPKATILFGQIANNGKGKKVFVKFNKGVLPSGEEIQIEGQALNPEDYSPGFIGQFHGNADMHIASTLGLTMVAGVTDVLTEKESIGGGGLLPGSVTPKATMKNAMLHGASQVAQSEANRQAESIGHEEEYVTVDAGSDVIVSLTKAYISK